MVHCTRAARAIKADALARQREAVASGSGEDCTEYRTLSQLRADIASILLMGQELPGNARYTTAADPTQNTRHDSDAGHTQNTSRTGAENENMSQDSNRAGGGIPDRDGDDSHGGRNNQSDSGNPDSDDGGAETSPGSSNSEGRSDGSNPEGRDGGAGVDDGVVVTGVGRGSNEGVGYVPFGESSAVGVSLVDEPPWAHALPDPVRNEAQLPELTGSNTGSSQGISGGLPYRIQITTGIPESTGTSLGGGCGVPGAGSGVEGVSAGCESPPEHDLLANDAPLEGTIMPAGAVTGAAGSDGPAASRASAGPAAGHSWAGAADGASAGHAAGASTGSTGAGDVPVEGLLVGDRSGYVDGVVDGIVEDSRRERDEQEAYLEQLSRLGGHPVLVDPPMPKALVLMKVSFLALLGITDEPAELDDVTAGPVPLGIARKLLAGSNTFLRVLTDAVTGAALPLEPERYTLKDSERSVLQALAGGCYFPNCTNPVLDTELDHVQSFDSGGKSTLENLLPACRKHHGLKHFADDKDRKGNLRRWAEPWRTGLPLHGWTPRLCGDGRVGWISPSGRYKAPDCIQPQGPAYPKWLKKRLDKALKATGGFQSSETQATGTQPTGTQPTDTRSDKLSPNPADFASPLEHRIITYLNTHTK